MSASLSPNSKPVYCTPNPVPNIPENNQVSLIDYRCAKIAAFHVEGRQLICLPQAFELFLKHLVGGLHTVYTKLKRLEIVPVVCNVEQVRILRGLGAIQPGVNRCKLIAPKEFDVLFEDCTNSSARPGRPSKRASLMPGDLSIPDSVKRAHFDLINDCVKSSEQNFNIPYDDEKRFFLRNPAIAAASFQSMLPLLGPGVVNPLLSFNMAAAAASSMLSGTGPGHSPGLPPVTSVSVTPSQSCFMKQLSSLRHSICRLPPKEPSMLFAQKLVSSTPNISPLLSSIDHYANNHNHTNHHNHNSHFHNNNNSNKSYAFSNQINNNQFSDLQKLTDNRPASVDQISITSNSYSQCIASPNSHKKSKSSLFSVDNLVSESESNDTTKSNSFKNDNPPINHTTNNNVEDTNENDFIKSLTNFKNIPEWIMSAMRTKSPLQNITSGLTEDRIKELYEQFKYNHLLDNKTEKTIYSLALDYSNPVKNTNINSNHLTPPHSKPVTPPLFKSQHTCQADSTLNTPIQQ